MKLAYSTYALQTVDPFEAVGRVRSIGYQGMELNVGDDWPTAPSRLDADARQRLCDAYSAAGFASPVLMNLIGLCGKGEDTAAKERSLAATCRLAADLDFDGGLRESHRIVWRDKPRRNPVHQDLSSAPDRRRHDRQSGGGSLQQHPPQRFLLRRMHQ